MLNRKAEDSGFTLVEVLLIILTLVVLGSVGYLVSSRLNKTSKISTTVHAPVVSTKTGPSFSGTVTADLCANSRIPIGDVGCSITINNNIVVMILPGNIAQTQKWGNLEGANLTTDITGKHVEVYAHKLSATSYTLEGSTSYYVKVTS